MDTSYEIELSGLEILCIAFVWTCINYSHSIRIQPNNIITYSYSVK